MTTTKTTTGKPVRGCPKMRDVVSKIDELTALLRRKAADPDLCHLDRDALNGLVWACGAANETLRTGAEINGIGY